jgi:SAM-dependent methyltransferase
MEVVKNWYKEWFNSPYYHILYGHHNEIEPVAFTNKLVQYLQPRPGISILDAACGRGRHARELSNNGFDVTGIDLSKENILYAKQFENKHLVFYQHDMRLPFRINYFDMVLNFFTSFGYFDTTRENENALRTFVQCLKLGGTLVLDYLNSNFVQHYLVQYEVKIIQGIEFIIHREMDKEKKVFLKNIKINDQLKLFQASFTECVTAYTRQDFEEMFARHGLAINEIFGDYHFNQYDENDSPRLILIANKN